MPTVNERACEDFGLDPKRVGSVARRIEKAAEEAREMGLKVMATGSGGGVLALLDVPSQLGEGVIIIADLYGGNYDGGDPDYIEYEDD